MLANLHKNIDGFRFLGYLENGKAFLAMLSEDCFLDLEIGYNHMYGKISHLKG